MIFWYNYSGYYRDARALFDRGLRHIFLYNHSARGDYDTEALIFKVAAARFLDVSEEETKKMKENAVALIIT